MLSWRLVLGLGDRAAGLIGKAGDSEGSLEHYGVAEGIFFGVVVDLLYAGLARVGRYSVYQQHLKKVCR